MLSLLFAGLLCVDDHPLSSDRTGMDWVLPFSRAQEESGKNQRLLMIKPVAFGTTPDGGW